MRYRIKKAKTGFVVTVEDHEGKVIDKATAKTAEDAAAERRKLFEKHGSA